MLQSVKKLLPDGWMAVAIPLNQSTYEVPHSYISNSYITDTKSESDKQKSNATISIKSTTP